MNKMNPPKFLIFTAAISLVALSHSAFAQDCNGLGTDLSNGRFYQRTETNPGGLVDPGISVISNVANRTGMLVGSSMRLQSESGGGFSGITTKADCIENASIDLPVWGGSGKGYWDTTTGVQVDVGSFPTSWNASQTLSASACWQKNWTAPGGATPTGYEFEFTVTFANNTQVDGLYWETLAPQGATPNTVYQVYVDGVAVGSPTNTPLTTGDPVSSDTGTTGAYDLDYYMASINQQLSGTHTISVVGVGDDFIMGDFAVMGCCTTVPEPSSVMLSSIAGLAFLLRRKR